jgi:hypothetical protein
MKIDFYPLNIFPVWCLERSHIVFYEIANGFLEIFRKVTLAGRDRCVIRKRCTSVLGTRFELNIYNVTDPELKKSPGLSPPANYTDRAIAASQQS